MDFLNNLSTVQLGGMLVFILATGLIVISLRAPVVATEAERRRMLIEEEKRILAKGSRLTKSIDREADRIKREKNDNKNNAEQETENTKVRTKTFHNFQDAVDKSGITMTTKQIQAASLVLFVVLFFGIFKFWDSFLVALVLSIPASYFLPRSFVKHLARRRLAKFVSQFPAALETIARGAKSGMPLKECFALVAEDGDDPIAGEFQIIMSRLSLGIPLKDAVRVIAARIPISETNFFSIAIAVQQQTGGSIAETLKNLATVLRMRKSLREKIGAATMEAKVSACIIGSLPILVAFFIHLSNPGYMEPLFTTVIGNIVLVASGVWMGIGIIIMLVLIRFKI